MTVQVANNLSNARKEQPAGRTHTPIRTESSFCQVINLVSLWSIWHGWGTGEVSGSPNTRFPAMSSLSFQAWTHAITSWCVSFLLPVSAFSCARRLPWLSAILKSTKILLVMALDLSAPHTHRTHRSSPPAKLAMSKCQWYMLYAPIRRPLCGGKRTWAEGPLGGL